MHPSRASPEYTLKAGGSYGVLRSGALSLYGITALSGCMEGAELGTSLGASELQDSGFQARQEAPPTRGARNASPVMWRLDPTVDQFLISLARSRKFGRLLVWLNPGMAASLAPDQGPARVQLTLTWYLSVGIRAHHRLAQCPSTSDPL